MAFGLQHMFRFLPLSLILGFFFACAIKPKPIYKIYPRPKVHADTAQADSASTTTARPLSPAVRDNTFPVDSAAIGDEGIIDPEATSGPADLPPAYPLSVSTQVWNLAQELIPFLGAPYRYGGEDTGGVDCSGLVRVVFARAFDIDLPHKAAYQYKMGKIVKKADLEAGDLVFFYERRSRRIGHVGLYLAENQFIHSMSGKGVVLSRLTEGYWKKHYAGARRFISN